MRSLHIFWESTLDLRRRYIEVKQNLSQSEKLRSFVPRMVRPRFVLRNHCLPPFPENKTPLIYTSRIVDRQLDCQTIAEFGEVKGVYAAAESGVRVIVSFADPFSAKAAIEALSGRPCPDLKGRPLHIRYSVLQLELKQVFYCSKLLLANATPRSQLMQPQEIILPHEYYMEDSCDS